MLNLFFLSLPPAMVDLIYILGFIYKHTFIYIYWQWQISNVLSISLCIAALAARPLSTFETGPLAAPALRFHHQI